MTEEPAPVLNGTDHLPPGPSRQPPPGPRSSRRKPAGDTATRQRVLDAAIQCILEQGLYRASSNAIAEQAGLSWGVIQYYFGTREALMLAVLDEGARRLTQAVQDAEIRGSTVIERVESYMETIAQYYGSPDYLAFTQVLISLSHDPRTSADTREHLERVSAATQPPLRRLQAEVLKGTGVQDPAVESLLFHSLRGLALSHVMLATIPSVDLPLVSQQFPAQRKLLAEALALLIEAHSGNAGLSGAAAVSSAADGGEAQARPGGIGVSLRVPQLGRALWLDARGAIPGPCGDLGAARRQLQRGPPAP
ncbi:MAG: regulatory protein TetR, partial [Actinomycetia bacterium]|nr:regulatory protein TetR [Actinomycetes bacterium]